MNPSAFSRTLFAAVLLLLAARTDALAAEADIFIGYDVSYANGVGGADNVEVNAMNAIAGSNEINARSGSPSSSRWETAIPTSSARRTAASSTGWRATTGASRMSSWRRMR
jgi:hypothetical protein